jgi:hypothetical protein
MLTYPELAREFSRLTAHPETDARHRADQLRRAFGPTGGRGVNTPPIGATHASRFVIVMVVNGLAIESARIATEYGSFVARPEVVKITGGDDGGAGSVVVRNPFEFLGRTLESALTWIMSDPVEAIHRSAIPSVLQIWRKGPISGAVLTLRGARADAPEHMLNFDNAQLDLVRQPLVPAFYMENRTVLEGHVIMELAAKLQANPPRLLAPLPGEPGEEIRSEVGIADPGKGAPAPTRGAGHEASGSAGPEAETPTRGANPEPAFLGSSVAQDGANRLNAAPITPQHTRPGGFFSTPTESRTDGPSSANATSRPEGGGPAPQRGPLWPTSRSRTSPIASPPSTALP